MGDINQLLYLKHYMPKVNGPILEIGSKDYGSTSSYRDYYVSNEYVGLDMAEGKGVDVIQDLTLGIGSLQESHFALVICCSVMEHVHKPWVMAENITRLVRPSGALFMSVPWVWRYHAYPDDYFRFSAQGIKALFPDFNWREMLFSTTVQGEFLPITDDTSPQADNKMATFQQTNNGQRKYLPYMMVNMLGLKN